MNENKQAVAVIAVAVGSVVMAGVKYAKTVRTERKKRIEIEEWKNREINAIHYASGYVQAKIIAGLYDGVDASVILNDMEFYRIEWHESHR